MQSILRMIGIGDINMFIYLNHKINCKFLDKIMPLVTLMGGAYFTIFVVALLGIFGDEELKAVTFKGATSLFVSFFIGFMIKKMLGRPRPYKVIACTNIGDKVWKDHSFPSGHTTAAFSLAVSYSLYYSELEFPLILCAALVGISRIYLGQHYPTDILAGALLGTTTSLLIFL